MSEISNAPTPRREFLGQIAASAVVLAGAACSTPAAVVQTAPVTPTRGTPSSAPGTQMHWDDSWVSRLTAKHKAVFDSPDIDEGATLGVSQSIRYLNGMRDALGAGAGEAQVVVVIRHHAIPFAFNDAMWEKYAIGEMTKIKSGEAFATRNPMSAPRAAGNRATMNGDADRPQANLSWLASHGHILLGCDLATQAYAGQIAQRVKGDARAITDELRANVVPGMILQPNGVYAVHRAQEAGCTYIRST